MKPCRRMSKFDIKTLEIAGFRGALEALRLPFGKECRSLTNYVWSDMECAHSFDYDTTISGDSRDFMLMRTLIKRGDEHAKVLRGIVVWAQIEAPIWLYRELETYRIGRERLSSESTMHIECKGLSGEELEAAKDAIPMGHIQKTVDMFSYQTLRRIYFQRRNHRLPMWHEFCEWIKTLPFADELITAEDIKE